MRVLLALIACTTLAAAEPASAAAAATASAVKVRPGRMAAEWQCGSWSPTAKRVSPVLGRASLSGEGTLEKFDKTSLLRLKDGQCLEVKMSEGPLAEARPFALEIEVVPDGTMKGIMAGLIQAGAYRQSGIRMMLAPSLKVGIEHSAGSDAEQVFNLSAATPLVPGRLQTVRYEHDGKQGRLFVDGRLEASKDCPPPAPWRGTMLVGRAGGKDYWYFGLVGAVRLQYLMPGH
jgi:hypothetical protein